MVLIDESCDIISQVSTFGFLKKCDKEESLKAKSRKEKKFKLKVVFLVKFFF